MSSSAPATVADMLPRMAASQPDATAIYFPTKRRDAQGLLEYQQVSYRELNERSDQIAAGLHAVGIARGDRAALMVKPSPELFALTFAMFKAGVVPVMIDPGLGIRGLATCLANAKPSAFIGIPLAHAARIALGWGRATVNRWIWVGGWVGGWFSGVGSGGHTLAQVEALGAARLRAGQPLGSTGPDEIAAVLFTSGSTGPAKGVVYRHRTFSAQVESIRSMFGIEPGEIDLPTFPLFALFDPALGMTTVLPDMDASKPARVDPRAIIEPIQRFGVTTMFGSPALLNTVGRHGEAAGVQLPSLRRVIAAGAPLPAQTIARWHTMLGPSADLFPPYGATESLPVACMPCREILSNTWAWTEQGAGVCVGAPVPAIEVRIIQITDDPIPSWDEQLVLPDGEVGEIAVRGPMVTEAYFNDAANTDKAKIREGERIWHRMGDVGWRDEHGRIWFCGRKTHRVVTSDGQTMFTVSSEKVFDVHPDVYRSALVGPRQGPTLCVELEPGCARAWDTIVGELRELAAREQANGCEPGRGLGGVSLGQIQHYLRYDARGGFPVDIRHNAKIGRERLRAWAQEQLP
ncbi:AMP-dependent synthetase/ligase in alkane synthesis cluster [Enhygromyxa salina]|uniref:AMP-dependent synthetase/ligase in alkane synthesis cluster n=1 Tax=Enhygromyxa salina TaxID=215803 RepID=A0A0C2D0U2_9BACT|nr:fatty acid CoA ligase family protein [Enhygromyxa salina]KIG15465.1 AMP-dependent synthetase/ligase in alkane synthesis cluster [Enhygromyxa salina]